MTPSLQNKTVLVVGRGSGIARAVADAAVAAGARVVAAGRQLADLEAAYQERSCRRPTRSAASAPHRTSPKR
jgi:NAD(P)-dependent dehydrogenase (short-subunit alcohol dehydrogenase family)